jgi:fructuronate reductase
VSVQIAGSGIVGRTADKAPVRIAHMGLGAFHRSHQAWYTTHATGDPWGIAGFTGRSPAAAQVLTDQDCVFTLIERGADGDRAEVIESIVEAHDGADVSAWTRTIAAPDVAVVTLTVTEAGYAPRATPPRRLVQGLSARCAADGGPLSVVACDNLPGNGQAMRAAVLALAAPDLAGWIDANVSFVDTMVDRITPSTTDADRIAARLLTGGRDDTPVVAEPFSEWVLAGEFPGGRPAWEMAGARFVADVAPYEERKLWLLNAAHSFLAYAGSVRGFDSIDTAFADDELRGMTEQLWAEQRTVLSLGDEEVDSAIASLRDRFANPRIRDSLQQIAQMGALKLPIRILQPMRLREKRGLAEGIAQRATIAAWAEYLTRFETPDAGSDAVARMLARNPSSDPVDLIIDTLTSEEQPS